VLARPVEKVATDEERAASPLINPRLLRRFRALRPVIEGAEGPPRAARVALGRELFADKRLSREQDLACASCHSLDHYGTDGQATSRGSRGRRGRRNAPSVYNAAGHLAQFWDGRTQDVETQALEPMLNAVEMDMETPARVVAVLAAVPAYARAFHQAFPGEREPITFANVGRALGAFERTLVTPSRWDRYLDGDDGALDDAELEGLRLFADTGCVQCHTGEYLGGSMFQRLGTAEPWPDQHDLGRFEITHHAADRMVFKVPSLRNVAMTAPYFHDGSAATLEDAVRLMARYQLGVDLDAREIASIIAWLKVLTGELPATVAAP
jgi:cytochrome c peroxidase